MYREAKVGVIRLSDGKEITPDRSNQEWLDYLAWFKAGGEVLPQVPEVEPIGIGQDIMWSRIKEERSRRENGGVLVSGKWFHTDAQSRIKWLGLLSMGAAVPAIPWKTMDGSFIPLSQATVVNVFSATASLDQQVFSVAETHKAQMLLASDPYLYDFSTGWPEIYGA